MKKMLVLAPFLLIFTLVFAGCGGSTTTVTPDPTPSPLPEGVVFMDDFESYNLDNYGFIDSASGSINANNWVHLSGGKLTKIMTDPAGGTNKVLSDYGTADSDKVKVNIDMTSHATYTVETKIKVDSFTYNSSGTLKQAYAGLTLYTKDGNNFYQVYCKPVDASISTGSTNVKLYITRKCSSNYDVAVSTTGFAISTGTWYTLKCSVKPSIDNLDLILTAELYDSSQTRIEHVNGTDTGAVAKYPERNAGLFSYNTPSYFDDFVIREDALPDAP